MDVEKTLAELRAERQQIEEAILSLERLARGRHRGPGRPPNMLADFSPTTPTRRGRPPGSKNKFHQPYDPNDPPPAAAMRVPRHRNGLIWAVAGRKRPDSGVA
jgi:hypothetical protein